MIHSAPTPALKSPTSRGAAHLVAIAPADHCMVKRNGTIIS